MGFSLARYSPFSWTRDGHEESQISNIHTYYLNNFLKLDGAVTCGSGCNIHQYLKVTLNKSRISI